MLQVEVSGKEEPERLSFRGIEQFTISQLRPGALVSSHDLVMRQRLAQRNRGTLVEEYPHLRRCQRASSSVLQNLTRLLDADSGEPIDELGYLCAVFEIFE